MSLLLLAATPLSTSGAPRLLSMGPEGAARLLGGTGRAKLVWDLLRAGEDPFGAAGAAALPPKTHRALLAGLSASRPTVAAEHAAPCGTRKLLFALEAGDHVEAVVIPHGAGGFSTLCVSSQVGCRQACSFCATGTMGLRRSLTAEEINLQVFEALRMIRERGMPPLRNVVFMGMGEPLDNAPAVQSSLQMLTHPFGFRLAKQHICVSTVGPSAEHIRQMTHMPARLAWSLHAADDELRKLLVPTTSSSMLELRDAFIEVLTARRDRGLMVELTLIRGVNDGETHAAQLCELLDPLPGKTRVNLIPYNVNAGLGAAGTLFQPSPTDAVRAFQRRVIEEGLICTVRTTRGDQEAAACGQLVTARMR
ncbi:hypothetical protein AB1Y20_013103 [Prymnesium parvum]|uniref:Radical SAM core domain-containing protein n=1 Tax=Prymnesium parvum TaxID=97485 RepID=A0AB34IMN6_PRYPA